MRRSPAFTPVANDDTIADRKNIDEIMRDENYADTALFQAFDKSNDFTLFRYAKRRSRLIHNQNLGFPMDRSSDRDSLSLTTRERSNGKIKSMHLNIETRSASALGSASAYDQLPETRERA